LRQYLLEPIEMFDACQARVTPQSDVAPSQTQGTLRGWNETMQYNHTRARRSARSVTASARASRHDDLEHSALGIGRDLGNLLSQCLLVRRSYAQPCATGEQAFQVIVEKTNAPTNQQRGLEQSVAILKATVVRSDHLRGLSIN
jgi:hypothetical protein